MKWLFAILLLMLLLFYYYRLFNVFFKIKKNKVFPLPDEVLEDIRIEPQRPIAEPKVASQKGSIFTYIFITCMVFIAIMFIVFFRSVRCFELSAVTCTSFSNGVSV
ncbi:hypothetical protein [Cytobacillus kochii]|uniref:Uncharacterized protein n=1 Tax=Cytobacillus kochii TaxID=859143 RepID=A0A248TGZ5_9BACI|nr:hypothetical protein [Cytobacillus kochii]ASV67360.1 hypothetical protein CKF48_08500 [Cytobacillus kochii]